MIILHNPLERASRNFVDLYGGGHTILEYPGCLEFYPYIRTFPSVVLPWPARFVPEEITTPSPDGPVTELRWLLCDPEPLHLIEPAGWGDVVDAVAGLVLTTPDWEHHLDLIEDATGVRPNNKEKVDEWITASVNRQVIRQNLATVTAEVRAAIEAMVPES